MEVRTTCERGAAFDFVYDMFKTPISLCIEAVAHQTHMAQNEQVPLRQSTINCNDKHKLGVV